MALWPGTAQTRGWAFAITSGEICTRVAFAITSGEICTRVAFAITSGEICTRAAFAIACEEEAHELRRLDSTRRECRCRRGAEA
jgi:hypothetical protein